MQNYVSIKNNTTHDIHIDLSDLNAEGIPCNHISCKIPSKRTDIENDDLITEDGIVNVPKHIWDRAIKREGYKHLVDIGDLQIVTSANKDAKVIDMMTGMIESNLDKAVKQFKEDKALDESSESLEALEDAPISPSLNEQKKAAQGSLLKTK